MRNSLRVCWNSLPEFFVWGQNHSLGGQHTDHWFNLCSKCNGLSSSSTLATSKAARKSYPPRLAERQLLSVQLQTSHLHGRRTEALAEAGDPECWEKAALKEPGTNLPVRGETMGQDWALQEVSAKSGQEAETRIPPASPWVRRHPPRAFQAEVTISIYGLQHIFFSSIFASNCIFF